MSPSTQCKDKETGYDMQTGADHPSELFLGKLSVAVQIILQLQKQSVLSGQGLASDREYCCRKRTISNRSSSKLSGNSKRQPNDQIS